SDDRRRQAVVRAVRGRQPIPVPRHRPTPGLARGDGIQEPGDRRVAAPRQAGQHQEQEKASHCPGHNRLPDRWEGQTPGRRTLVAPLDVLVVNADGGKRFHIIETNGTGIGGLTNMPASVTAAVLAGLAESAEHLVEPNPLVLVASSGIESSKHPRQNHLIHEKVLYVEALRRGFEARGGSAKVLTMTRLAGDPAAVRTDRPTIVL